jgi:hypothetical protein
MDLFLFIHHKLWVYMEKIGQDLTFTSDKKRGELELFFGVSCHQRITLKSVRITVSCC